MPENEQPPTPATPEASSSAPPTGKVEPWRAGQHSTFAGRSAEEILGIAEAQRDELARRPQPVQQHPQAPPQNRFDLDIPDDEYVSGQRLKQIVQQFANQPAPVDYVGRQQSAGALLAAVQMRRADDFKRWGPEITQELNKLAWEHWTLDNLEIMVNIVKSRHIDELAAEKAQRLVDESHPTIRSGTGGSVSGPQLQQNLDSDGIPAEWVQQARTQGITESQVREFCEVAGITERQYYADLVKYGKSAIIRG